MLGTSLDHIKDDEHTQHRCLHLDTNIALAFEQNGMWEQASNAYNVAQNKARTDTIPFFKTKFCLWEDGWILAAGKLQQWDILRELTKSEGNQELMLECAWRTTQWVDQIDTLEEQIAQLPEVPTPRHRVFEAFIALLKLPAALDKNIEFTKILEDAITWEKKSSDLKMVLQASDSPICKMTSAYGGEGAANNTQTFDYRGYHKTAWFINQFAHVARKHDSLDACFTSLTKIYTLPNIKISEAFLKLREQARCRYQKPNDLQAGLEVVNNTNLVFFSVA
ncbi:hypothetical protein DFH06DRAFT_1337873 [Mycena polygramma]|nr:hypothetical protein DFH06DRAFT_1337873 [Mycena polygramma]